MNVQVGDHFHGLSTYHKTSSEARIRLPEKDAIYSSGRGRNGDYINVIKNHLEKRRMKTMIKAINRILLAGALLAFMSGAVMSQTSKPEKPSKPEHPKAEQMKPGKMKPGEMKPGEMKPEKMMPGQMKQEHQQPGQQKPDHPTSEHPK
ncbi:MAG: hypothetical protein PHU44_00585 [Syntrophales bacterium]|nr:hypothetical protein [Syntrophales bacterium]MDD5640945.1 hypothetical protein [Syntrophales bacterium]